MSSGLKDLLEERHYSLFQQPEKLKALVAPLRFPGASREDAVWLRQRPLPQWRDSKQFALDLQEFYEEEVEALQFLATALVFRVKQLEAENAGLREPRPSPSALH